MTNSHRPCLIVSPITGLEAFAGGFPTSPTILILAVDELKWLVSVAPSPVTLVISSYFQFVKYPSLEVTALTSISPESIATTRDIDGRNVGDA